MMGASVKPKASTGAPIRSVRPSTAPMEIEEPCLLQQVAAGDSTAVRRCIDRYSSLVWSLVRSQLQDFSLAEDLVQEIFIELWRSASRFDPAISSEGNFIAVVARRRLIDRRRSLGRRSETEGIEDLNVPTEDSSLERVDVGDEARLATQALEKLRPEQRHVLELSVVAGLSHSQIAHNTGMPLGTVKSHLRRGLDRVRELLDAGPQAGEVTQ